MLNVDLMRIGRGAAKGLGSDLGRYVVTTMPLPWTALEGKLGRSPEEVVFVESVELEYLDRLVETILPIDAVMGAGGGMAVDAAKYLSWRLELPLVTVPTIISTDAFVTSAVGVRENARVRYLGDAHAQLLVIDFDILRDAPRALNIAGMGDILSCHTACFDWELAWSRGVRDNEMDTLAVRQARQLVQQLASHTGDLRQMNERALKLLVDVNVEVVEICHPMGHYRAEEGSEHFLFYSIESVTRRPFLHGPIVGFGIDVMTALQGNEHDWIVQVMNDAGLDHSPLSLGLSRTDVHRALEQLPRYVRDENLWHSAIDVHGISSDFIEETLERLDFARADTASNS